MHQLPHSQNHMGDEIRSLIDRHVDLFIQHFSIYSGYVNKILKNSHSMQYKHCIALQHG